MNKTPISMLQELTVQRKKCLPDYIIEGCNDMPGANFKCTVKVDELCTCGYGTTKKEAKQNSAEKALELLGFSTKETSPMSQFDETTTCTELIPYQISQKSMPFINYVGKLNEFASTNGRMYPNYVDSAVSIGIGFVTNCNFLNFTTEGYGLKKKDSKQDAARKMLERLRTEDVSSITGMMSELHVEKMEKIDKLSEEILKKYENISSSPQNIAFKNVHIKPIPNIKVIVATLEELKCELQKYDYTFTIEIFQKDPYIMMMKIDGSHATIMGKGDTKDEALTDLYETALHMFSNGVVV